MKKLGSGVAGCLLSAPHTCISHATAGRAAVQAGKTQLKDSPAPVQAG